MLIIVGIALFVLSITTAHQTAKLRKTRQALEASDSVVLEAERIIRQRDIEDAVLDNPVLRGVMLKFFAQTDKGMQKYGRTVDPGEYTEEQWLQHFQQEMIDGAVYVETLLQKRSDGI